MAALADPDRQSDASARLRAHAARLRSHPASGRQRIHRHQLLVRDAHKRLLEQRRSDNGSNSSGQSAHSQLDQAAKRPAEWRRMRDDDNKCCRLVAERAQREAARAVLRGVLERAREGAARAGRAAAAAAGQDAAADAAGGRVRPARRLLDAGGGESVRHVALRALSRRGRTGAARSRVVQVQCRARLGPREHAAGQGAARSRRPQTSTSTAAAATAAVVQKPEQIRAAEQHAQRQVADAHHLRGQSDAPGHGPDQLLQVYRAGDERAREPRGRVPPRRGLVREGVRREGRHRRRRAVRARSAADACAEEAVLSKGVQLGAPHRRNLSQVLRTQSERCQDHRPQRVCPFHLMFVQMFA